MPFDKPTRNTLARLVAAARNRLVEDLTAQLQTDFRLQPDGTALPLDGLTDAQRAAAEDLRELLAHYRAALPAGERQPGKASFDRLVREIGFTVLNRLAALRLGEERGLVVQCVGQGLTSEGFQLYERLTGGALGSGYNSYRSFLYNLFDELAIELGALFDTRTPLSQVFPTERALLDVLALLNTADLAWIWREDETIGWIYQYYNDEAERKKMRDESQAPRNSRELAVRNQFFTPRYVVEFLADNTLGRLWYEMRGGDTRLAEECRYLVRQPVAEGAALPARAKKDPRNITMLDPAGGSGHFGLYCFDLFETIYAEAWDDPGLGPALREGYEDRAAFDRAVPRLILAHNIHIIDIDQRAVQIAALALWLRAQRSYQRLGLKAAERPQVTRVNVVTAEPMPGDQVLLNEFVAGLRPRVLGDLVQVIFEKMKLAGEAGSLLKIEDELHEAIAAAKTQWLAGDKAEQLALLPPEKQASAAEQLALFDVSDVSDESFFDEAEAKVLEALRDYAGQAENGQATRRQLFAHDAAQGFSFIELCRKRYDLVLMNPPFGEVTTTWKSHFEEMFALSKTDLYAAFVEHWADHLRDAGLLGAITSRTCFFLTSFKKWRSKLLGGRHALNVCADLGNNVLDSALVQTAAYCLSRGTSNSATFIRLLAAEDKAALLLDIISAFEAGRIPHEVYTCEVSSFSEIPGMPLAYWISKSVRNAFTRFTPLESDGRDAQSGASTMDDFRFLRAWWEVDVASHARTREDTLLDKRWAVLAKGGAFSRYYCDWELVIDWKKDGKQVKQRVADYRGRRGWGYHWAAALNGHSFYFRPGLTWPRRTQGGLNARVLPAGCIIGDKGPAVFDATNASDELWSLLGLMNARVFRGLVALQMTFGSYEVGVMERTPVPDRYSTNKSLLPQLAKASTLAKRQLDQYQETSHIFGKPVLCESSGGTLQGRLNTFAANVHRLDLALASNQEQIDRVAQGLYSFGPKEAAELEIGIQDESNLDAITTSADTAEGGIDGESSATQILVSYLLGCGVGRWDIRLGAASGPLPGLQDPFDPLPICPPGMLVGQDGLPATPDNIVSEEWLRARPNAITLPPEGSVSRSTISDAEFPLRISWNGILVDDPGLDPEREDLHQADIVRRVREALALLWGERAGALEQEACEILGVRNIRDYFRKPNSLFANHVKQYSKSRRQAPIYWPLSTASGDYTVWVYYHRLTGDTLYTIVNGYVKPKIEAVQARIDRLTEQLGGAKGRDATTLRDEIDGLRRFLGELNDFQAELLRVAALPYKPNLNDGVILNAAPLHKLFRLRKWAADCKAVWEKLEAGDYNWAHIAYTIWPEPVKKACETDRSIAIAHGLEHLYKGETKPASNKPVRKKKAAGQDAEAMELGFDE